MTMVLVPREPSEAPLLALMFELHSNVPEADRPMARMDFSDDQWTRIEAGYKAMLAASPPSPEYVVLPREVVDLGLLEAVRGFVWHRGNEELARRLDAVLEALREALSAKPAGGES